MSSSPVSRGFRHLRRPSAGQEGRVPPGQYVTQGFPVLSAGPIPRTPWPEWTFSIRQGGETLKSWTGPALARVPCFPSISEVWLRLLEAYRT